MKLEKEKKFKCAICTKVVKFAVPMNEYNDWILYDVPIDEALKSATKTEINYFKYGLCEDCQKKHLI